MYFVQVQKFLPIENWNIIFGTQIIKDMKKNGRPLLEKPVKRKSHPINAYCTEEEKKQIKNYAKESGLSVSEYIIKKCLDEKTIPRRIELLKELGSVNLEITRAGNNINQLAKHANRIKNSNGLDSGLFLNYNLLLNDYLKKTEDIKKIVKSIYREIAR
jgi:hypothetical protein